MAFSPITSWVVEREKLQTLTVFFSWAPKSWQTVTEAMKLKDTCSLGGKLYQLRQHVKKQRRYFANKSPSSQGYGLSSSDV